MAGLQKLFGVGSTQGITNPYQTNKVANNFVKNTFDFGIANPNRPETRVVSNALGDPKKGCNLYYLA